MEPDPEITIFEDEEDYIEDIKDQFREAVRRYTVYCKMFGDAKNLKYMKDELRRFIHYELESSFSHMLIKPEGIIIMKFDENGPYI